MTNLLAVSSQQRIGLAVVLVMMIGWVIYLLSAAKRTYEPGSEITDAPNRKPYYDDEGMEGKRLTKYLWWAFAMLAISAVGLPAYWVREPFRQTGAGLDRGTAWFEEEEVKRGEWYFENSPGDPPTPREPHYGCESCHGKKGIGGVAQYTLVAPVNPDALPKQVQWTAPALNTVMLRFRPEEVLWMVARGELTEGHARAVLALPDHDARKRLAKKIVRDGMSVRAAEKAAREGGAARRPRSAPAVDPALAERARGAAERLTGLPARVSAGKLEIHFGEEVRLEELVEVLESL